MYGYFFLMIRRPPRSTQGSSSAASDVYKRQVGQTLRVADRCHRLDGLAGHGVATGIARVCGVAAVSYTHLRAHETVLDLVCRLLLEKKKTSLH